MLSKNAAAAIILIIVVIAIVVAFFSGNPANYDKSRTKIFVTILTGLGIFVTFFFYYNVVDLQAEQQLMMSYDRIESIDDNMTENYINVIQEHGSKIPKFVKSILPLQNHLLPDLVVDETTFDAVALKYSLSNKIFLLWKDYISYYNYITSKDYNFSYLTNFLQRAHSKELKTFWESMKIDYSEDVQDLGDLLFKYSKGSTIDDYHTQTCFLMKDPIYIKLIDNIEKKNSK